MRVKLWSALPESASGLSEEACDSEGLSFCMSRLCIRGWDLEKTAPLLLEIVLLEQAAASDGSRRETWMKTQRQKESPRWSQGWRPL